QDIFYKNLEKFQSVFPEVEALSNSNIEALKAKIDNGESLDALNISKSPVETYTKEVDGDFYSLNVYAILLVIGSMKHQACLLKVL
ncbi:hypothetical protein, partial [Alkalibacter mobilis]|uniref:hypothetical protein n=1 Tax=Alkalibacter mobilis TaxID=2787712 RepID=UPI0018A03E20